MGIWGPGIFSDDVALDVKESFRSHIANGGTLESFMQDFYRELGSHQAEPVVWIALAATQWQLGRLDARVKQEALRLITTGEALVEWQNDPKLLTRRSSALNKLAVQLNSPPKPARKLSPRYVHTCEWQAGDLVAYQLRSGAWIVFHVQKVWSDLGGQYPNVHVLEGLYSEPPTQLLSTTPVPGIIGFTDPDIAPSRSDGLCILTHTSRSYPASRLKRLASPLPLPLDDNRNGFGAVRWKDLDSTLAEVFGIAG